MKKSWQTAVLLAAMLGLGFTGQVAAAEKSTQAASKKATTTKVAVKSARQPVRVARPGARAKVATTVAAPAVRKAVHKVSMADLGPGKLALLSASALVVDQATGRPVFQKNPDAVVPIASISKLMTAMVVLDARQDMQETITITDDDVDYMKGTRSRLQVGTTLTREMAMLLALMSSENRAANALGRHYPGGLKAFVSAMNHKAVALGMANTRFEEPTGLSSNNVSTASDLAKMVSAASQYAEIRGFSTTAEARVDVRGRIQDFRNTNALVKNDRWEIGVSKTGYISEAGRCLVMQARVADKPVVIVLLDSNGKMTRVGDAIRIKRWMESAHLAPDGKSV